MSESESESEPDPFPKLKLKLKPNPDLDPTSAMKKALFHANLADEWIPHFFGFAGDAKRSNFHRQVSLLYTFRAARGLPCEDLDRNIGLCMKNETHNLRVGCYEGTCIVPFDGYDMNFSIGSSATKDWRVSDFRSEE